MTSYALCRDVAKSHTSTLLSRHDDWQNSNDAKAGCRVRDECATRTEEVKQKGGERGGIETDRAIEIATTLHALLLD